MAQDDKEAVTWLGLYIRLCGLLRCACRVRRRADLHVRRRDQELTAKFGVLCIDMSL